MPPATTCQTLSEARVCLAWLLSRTLLEADVSHEELAAAAGCSRYIVDAWCDRRNADKSITVAHLLIGRVPDTVVIPLVRAVLEARGYAPPAKQGAPAELADDLQALSRLAAQAGKPVAEYARAIADGTLTPAEARALIAACDDAMDQLAAVRERAKDALPTGDSVRISSAERGRA